MTILIDTREQRPLPFICDAVLTATKRVTLPVGDYQVEFTDGTRPPLTIERKSLGDLFGTMGRGYPRFRRMLQKARQKRLQVILVVEATMTEVLEGDPHSSLAGSSIMRKLLTLWIKYDLVPIFCADAAEAAWVVRELFEAVGRLHVASHA